MHAGQVLLKFLISEDSVQEVISWAFCNYLTLDICWCIGWLNIVQTSDIEVAIYIFPDSLCDGHLKELGMSWRCSRISAGGDILKILQLPTTRRTLIGIGWLNIVQTSDTEEPISTFQFLCVIKKNQAGCDVLSHCQACHFSFLSRAPKSLL